MNQYLSDKIKVISMLCIILVLYIHSGFHDYPHEIKGMVFNHYLQDFISGIIGRIAVPMFYMISGYLFFVNANKISDVWNKMKRRVRSLVVPFVIAALFFPTFIIVLENIPFASQFMNASSFSDVIYSMPVKDILSSLFYDSGNGSPWAFQLWFLRDLIIIVAFTPIIYYIRKNVIIEVFTLLLLYLLTLIDVPINPSFAMFWFVLGSSLLSKLHKINIWYAIIPYMGISLIELFFDIPMKKYILIPIILIGVLSLWNLYDIVVGGDFKLSKHGRIVDVCRYSFFIYLFHEPTLNIVRKILSNIGGHSSISFALAYLLSPWIFSILWIMVGKIMQKYIPNIYKVCVGGR